MREEGNELKPGKRRGPLLCAATFLGLGLGGFLDGIWLHQILQWHQMISKRLPPDTLLNAKVNMFWDGMFHLGTWSFTVLGVAFLWQLLGRTDVLLSKWLLWGGLVFGWGIFNLMDSVFNHYIFRLHNVRENAASPATWNLAFLLLGVLLTAAGWAMISRSRR